MSSADFFGIGTAITIRLPGIPQPELSPLGTGYIYFDSGSNKFKVSQNGGAYVDLVGGGAGSQTLAQTLVLGNTTGGTSIVVSSGDAINGAGALPIAAGPASDLTLAAHGSTPIAFNQAGQLALNAAYTGPGRTSVIGALNALVDGTIVPGTPALSAVLAVGNTTGANNISVNGGQKVVSAAASALTLDGTTTLDLQTAATTRWQVTAAGHLVPAATDNLEDIGGAATNRIRTLYAGTSVVVGSSVTVTTNSVSGSVGLALSATTGAASLSAAAGTTTVSTAGGGNVIVDSSGIIDLKISGTSRWQVSAAGDLLATTDGTNSIGAAAANRPLNAFLSNSVAVGATATAAVLSELSLLRTGSFTVSAAGVASDLTLNARGAGTNFNQVGQTALNATYTGAGRTSLIGAINALVDGTVTPNAPALSAVLAVGNTTGAHNISVNGGQKVVSAAASALTLDGTTTLDLQTGAATRWQVTATGHLVPGTTDNAEDIGGAATNRIRTLYAGTSVVVGATITVNGIANTITSNGNLGMDTGAAGTMNLGTTNATTVNVGAGAGTTQINAQADVTVAGNLTVNGTTTTVNSTNLTVTDPLIYANNGGANPSFAGIAWDQGAALDIIMVWNPTNTRIEFGRFNTVGGTVVPSGALTTLTDIRGNNLTLAGTTVTADAGLTVTATAAALALAATGANPIQLSTNGVTRFYATTDGGFATVGLAANPSLSAAGDAKIIYNTTSNTLRASLNGGAYADLATAASVTLQNAYNGGNTISTAGAIPVVISDTNADTADVLQINKTPGSAQAGNGISVAMGSNATGLGLSVTSAATGIVTASFSNTASGGVVAIGNGSSAAAPLAGTLRGTNSSTSGTAGGGLTVTAGAGNNATGGVTTVSGGAGASTNDGADLVLTGGAAGVAANKGGRVSIQIYKAGAGTTPQDSWFFYPDAGFEFVGRPTPSEPAVSAASNGRIYYNTGGQGFKVSNNGTAYKFLVTASSAQDLSLQNTYTNGGGGITLALSQGPIAISNPAATAQSALTVTQGTAGQFAIDATGDSRITGKLTVTGVVDPTQVLLTGADKRFGATDAGTVYLAPFANSTTGVQVRKADNTTVVLDVDTTNAFVGVSTASPSSTLHVSGSFATKTTSITGNTSADATTTVYLCNATGGTFTLTLPLASSCTDRRYTVKKTDTSGNAVSVAASGGDLIDGAASQSVTFPYESIDVVSDGTNWWVV